MLQMLILSLERKNFCLFECDLLDVGKRIELGRVFRCDFGRVLRRGHDPGTPVLFRMQFTAEHSYSGLPRLRVRITPLVLGASLCDQQPALFVRGDGGLDFECALFGDVDCRVGSRH